jgi:hypothetical protein
MIYDVVMNHGLLDWVGSGSGIGIGYEKDSART